MIPDVLPQCGRVLGIDVVYSLTKPTTAFCCLSWDQARIDWSKSLATAKQHSRHQALRAIRSKHCLHNVALLASRPHLVTNVSLL